MIDDRQNLPSASEYHRVFHCPGMLNLKRSLGPLPDESSPDAESGTRIAAVLAGQLKPEELTDEELKTHEKLVRGREAIRSAVFNDEQRPQIFNAEERLWLYQAREKIFSGRFDALYRFGDTALIIDDKSGRNEVTKADGNLQLRSLAVLLWMSPYALGLNGNPSLSRVVVAINQPWFTPAFSLCEYDGESIGRAYNELLMRLEDAAQPDAPRHAGPWCKYCKCAGPNCPESMAVPLNLATVNPTTLATGDQIAAFLDRVAQAEDVIEAVKLEAKRRIESDPQSVPGWTLKPGRVMEDITAPETVYARADLLGVNQQQFMAAVKVQKGALKDAVKSATKKRGKELDAAMDELLDGCTSQRFAAPSLAREKDL